MSFERRFGEFEDQNTVAVGVSQKPSLLRSNPQAAYFDALLI
jgi:hypothetical protein